MANEDCKAFLKYFRKEVKAKKDEKIDKRYKPYLAPNNKSYGAHCGYCAEVQYLTEIHEKPIDYQEEDQKRAQKLIDIKEVDLMTEGFPCQTFATAEERERYLGRYKPNQNNFNAYIDYIIGRPGQKATYEGFRKFVKERGEKKQ